MGWIIGAVFLALIFFIGLGAQSVAYFLGFDLAFAFATYAGILLVLLGIGASAR